MNFIALLFGGLLAGAVTISGVLLKRELASRYALERSSSPALRTAPVVFAAVACCVITPILYERLGANPRTAVSLIACAMLLCAAIVDAELKLLPDVITLPLACLSILASYLIAFQPITQAVVGAAVGWGIVEVPNAVARMLGKQECIGKGDAKLMAAIGSLVGATAAVTIMLVACIAILAVALPYRRARYDGDFVPFGPALCLAAVLSICAWPYDLLDCVLMPWTR